MNKIRYRLAVAASPLVPAMISLVPMLHSESSQFNILALGLALLTSYLGLIVIGLPLVHLLMHFGWLNLLVLTITGALSGIVVFTLFLQGLEAILKSHSPIQFIQILLGAGLGLISALSFGLISGIASRSTRTRTLSSRFGSISTKQHKILSVSLGRNRTPYFSLTINQPKLVCCPNR